MAERNGVKGWVPQPPHSLTATLNLQGDPHPMSRSARGMLTLLEVPTRLPAARYGHLRRPPLPVSPLPAPGDSG